MPGKDAAIVALDSTHSRAVCDEIGERLRDVLGRDVPEIPSFLRRLVDRLAELERVPAPSIVPEIEHSHLLDPEPTSRRRSDLALSRTI